MMQDKDKIAEYDRLAAENSELKSELENLRKQIACLKKAVYGPKSEKTEVVLKDSQQMPLEGVFNEAETEECKEESVTVPGHKRKKKRSREEIVGNLPTEEVVHYVEDRSCDVCGSEMTAVGKEFVRDELVYVPAKLFVRKHYSEVLKCTKCGADESRDAENEDVEKCRFKKADVPAPLIPHSFCSAELLAHIIYEKYINAVPLYRQEKSFKNIGADISRTTMANWIIYTALEKAKPIYSAMKRELLKGDVIHADETPVQVLHEDGRKATSQSRMWVYCSPMASDKHIVLYDYCKTRAGSNAVNFLGDYSGYLVCDGYDGYNKLNGVRRCGCWAHLRRKFTEALPADENLKSNSKAGVAIDYCNKIFASEASTKGLPKEERRKKRLEEMKPLLDDFYAWLDSFSAAGGSALQKAVQYARNEKKYLYGFLENPDVEPHNNCAENAIRPFVVGRKNWLFSSSPKGAHTSAIIYSLAITAEKNGLNALKYFTDLLSSPEPLMPY